MNPSEYHSFADLARIKQEILKVVEERNIQIENLTRSQAVDAFFQAMMAGDLSRYIMFNPDKQTVVYIPGQGVDELRTERDELKKIIKEIRHIIYSRTSLDDMFRNIFFLVDPII